MPTGRAYRRPPGRKLDRRLSEAYRRRRSLHPFRRGHATDASR
jgi:hypothetical protein